MPPTRTKQGRRDAAKAGQKAQGAKKQQQQARRGGGGARKGAAVPKKATPEELDLEMQRYWSNSTDPALRKKAADSLNDDMDAYWANREAAREARAAAAEAAEAAAAAAAAGDGEESQAALAKRESSEHLHQLAAAIAKRDTRPLRVVATRLSEEEVAAGAAVLGGEADTMVVHFIRHGQGHHNVAGARGPKCDCHEAAPSGACPYLHPSLLDPRLTAIGRGQALDLQARARAMAQPELIVVSPMVRATETAVLAFAHAWGTTAEENAAFAAQTVESEVSSYSAAAGTASSIPFVAVPDATEQSGQHICDKRRPRTELEAMFSAVDYATEGVSALDELWGLTPGQREDKIDVSERAFSLAKWLRPRAERNIVVATHSAFLYAMFQSVLDCGTDEALASWFDTGEMRSVKLKFEDR